MKLQKAVKNVGTSCSSGTATTATKTEKTGNASVQMPFGLWLILPIPVGWIKDGWLADSSEAGAWASKWKFRIAPEPIDFTFNLTHLSNLLIFPVFKKLCHESDFLRLIYDLH